MENTSCGQKCPFVKTGFCSNETECPFYLESWWQQGQTGEPKLVKDCSPKRTAIQLAALQLRFEGVQLAAEQSRNETALMKGLFQDLIVASQNAIDYKENEQLKISKKED